MRKIFSLSTIVAIMLSMIISSSVTTFAAAPYIEEIEYKSNGRVEVDFYGKVQYKNVKVTVKDTSGKKYTVKNVIKDNDDIKFTIKNFKKGKTYKITVKGVKERGTSGFSRVIGKLKVPKDATGKKISRSKAVSMAKKHAKKNWGAKGIWDIDVESDRYQGQSVWEVSFNATIGGEEYEFEYKIAKKGGKILKKEKEWDG